MKLISRLVPTLVTAAAIVACVLAFYPIRAAADLPACATWSDDAPCDFAGGLNQGVCAGELEDGLACDCWLFEYGIDSIDGAGDCLRWGAPE